VIKHILCQAPYNMPDIAWVVIKNTILWNEFGKGC